MILDCFFRKFCSGFYFELIKYVKSGMNKEW